ncbi:uncharacterized protein LOC119091451 [Pollicipes pollicipes]|uniref:uncharacterized protein LOC119091451 n=1 Tax=Pollicipes pollicipes TaxID=41117 RepID=UPI001884D02C|nr:uncharacterized protein LOC119091451 [Pollicipes pollicipes]
MGQEGVNGIVFKFLPISCIQSDSREMDAAVTLAQEGDSVTYVTSEPLEALPPPVHGMPLPAADSMHRVRFVYLPSVLEVVDYLSSLHLSARLPDALLVDAPCLLEMGHECLRLRHVTVTP